MKRLFLSASLIAFGVLQMGAAQQSESDNDPADVDDFPSASDGEMGDGVDQDDEATNEGNDVESANDSKDFEGYRKNKPAFRSFHESAWGAKVAELQNVETHKQFFMEKELQKEQFKIVEVPRFSIDIINVNAVELPV